MIINKLSLFVTMSNFISININVMDMKMHVLIFLFTFMLVGEERYEIIIKDKEIVIKK
jgi:hypothetical protein